MSETKHTPGEWHLDDEGDIVTTSDCKGNIVCHSPANFERSMKFWPANARLIAAAPELLEALNGWLVAWEDGKLLTSSRKPAELYRAGLLHDTKAAIAKAEGREAATEGGSITSESFT
jgi:hypothetical protein